jgi:hypothetical protein
MAGRPLKLKAWPVGNRRRDTAIGCVTHRMVEVRDLAAGPVVVGRLRHRMGEVGRGRPRRMCAVKLAQSRFPRVLAVHNLGIAMVDGRGADGVAVNRHQQAGGRTGKEGKGREEWRTGDDSVGWGGSRLSTR